MNRVLLFIVSIISVAVVFNGCESRAIYEPSLSDTITQVPITVESPNPTSAFVYDELMFDTILHRREVNIAEYILHEASDFEVFKTTEGTGIEAYCDEDLELQILKICFFGETGRRAINYYPITEDGITAVTTYEVKYSSTEFNVFGDPVNHYVSAMRKMIIKDGQLYYFIDRNEPLCQSGNAAEYLDIFDKAKMLVLAD
ncbi:MAG: hypothetical protein FWD16_00790 [Clostridia bacterium]|nr:hypothetical protein [Clostridia bacterium]